MNSKTERLKHVQAARARRDWQGALAELEQILRDYGLDANVLSLLALTENDLYQDHWGENEPEIAEPYLTAALQHIHEAIALEPTNSRYYCDLGFILMITEVPRTQESLDVYRRAIEVDPLDWYPLYTVTCFFAYHPDADLGVQEAIGYGERALQIRPTRDLWKTMAELYESAGDLAASERAKQAALTAPQE